MAGRGAGKDEWGAQRILAPTYVEQSLAGAAGPTGEIADILFGLCWKQATELGIRVEGDSRWSSQEGNLALKRGGVVRRRSTDSKAGNVGVRYRHLVWDEVCRSHNGLRVWSQDFRPTLSGYDGQAVWITTPSGWDFVHALHQRIVDHQEPDWGYVEAASWENEYLYPGGRNDPEILAAEREYEQAGLPELFLQEYGAQFRILTGVILRKWDPKQMVVGGVTAWKGCSTFYLGYDWGFDHPAVWILLGRAGRDWRALDEDYGTEEDPERIMARGLAICQRNGLTPAQIERLYYDPSRPEQGAMFRRIGDFAASPARPYDFDSRVMALAGPIGRPGGFLVNGDRCKRLPVELSMWRWAQDAGTPGVRRPVKLNEDGVDATAGVLSSVYAAESRDQATNDAYARGRGVALAASRRS